MGFSSHSVLPCTYQDRYGSIVIEDGIGLVLFFLNLNQVQGGVGFCNNLTCLILPPTPFQNEIKNLVLMYKYLFPFQPSSLILGFPFLSIVRVAIPLYRQSCHSSLSLELSFLILNAEIHLIIHTYHIIKSIGSLISSHHCHFLPLKHIFSHPRTGMILCSFVFAFCVLEFKFFS